ncbi:YcaO-like family protein [Candidatus Kaiserbacteria bacterium]|nr:YcaO-like family protein [Candidatus Kaiserbacteria bacterium]
MSNPSALFDKAGYIALKEYLGDFIGMRRYGPWKLPLRLPDRIQLFFLRIVSRLSWFSDRLYVCHESNVSPAYGVLLQYLKKKRVYDAITERDLHFRGYFSYFARKDLKINGKKWSFSGQGVAEDKATALSKALGEITERAISGAYDMNKAIRKASPDELAKEAPILYPPRFHRFLDIQKEASESIRYDPSVPIDWVRGINLVTKETTYIPRHMTSWFIENRNKQKFFTNSTTNGAAGYFTREGAVLRGLLEAVQRDAFLVHWLTTIPPRLIDTATMPEYIQYKIREFETFGVSLSILDVSSIPIPSVFIAGMNIHAEIPQIVLSGGSALTFEEAILSALQEMIVASEMFYYPYDGSTKVTGDTELKPFISDLDKIGRQLYWRGADKVRNFSWFLSGECVSYGEVCKGDLQCEEAETARIEACLSKLRACGEAYYPIVYYPENNIQKEIGFYIAQVYIPKAFPLYLIERFGTFDSDRLQEFALSKGFSKWQLNPYPHMFS